VIISQIIYVGIHVHFSTFFQIILHRKKKRKKRQSSFVNLQPMLLNLSLVSPLSHHKQYEHKQRKQLTPGILHPKKNPI
jgi:hypothetical protein